MATKTQSKKTTKKPAAAHTVTAPISATPKRATRETLTKKTRVKTKVSPKTTAAKKPAAKTPATKKPTAKKSTAIRAATTPLTAHTSTQAPAIYPAPHYTRWTLITVGEYYLFMILGCLAVLGVAYWFIAMNSLWSFARVA